MEETAEEDDLSAEDRKLFEISKVWSEADARRLEYVLDVAGIPFYMGREMATSVDDVTSKFEEGLPVRVMRIGRPWAYDAMWRNYFPGDEQPKPQYEDAGDVATQCPWCRSTEVVFDELVDRAPGAAPKYRWNCASCDHAWGRRRRGDQEVTLKVITGTTPKRTGTAYFGIFKRGINITEYGNC